MIDPRPVFYLIVSCLFLVSCATTEPYPSDPGPAPYQRPPVVEPITGPYVPPIDPGSTPGPDAIAGLVPPHMQGRPVVRLALLLPFSSKNSALREEAQSMLDAAELAIFESGDNRVLLIPKDTGGSANGAREAARSAINDGADVFIGPLLSRAVSGAAPLAAAQNIPLISFSTDRKIAGNGVYLMSFQPETEVARIIEYAARQDIETFALLHGQTAYGRRVETAMQTRVAAIGAVLTDVESYPRPTRDMNAPASRIAHTPQRTLALDEWQANGGIGDPALDPAFVFELPYAAILLPESGIRLQSLAPLLPYYDVDPRKTRFLGTGLWFDESLTREPALTGGWFPGPDQAGMTAFRDSFLAAYSSDPKRLAPLTYDAVRVAGSIAETTDMTRIRIRRDWLEDPRGFNGATGLFRFNPDGLVEHKLAIYEMRRGRFKIIDPAPLQFDPPVN